MFLLHRHQELEKVVESEREKVQKKFFEQIISFVEQHEKMRKKNNTISDKHLIATYQANTAVPVLTIVLSTGIQYNLQVLKRKILGNNDRWPAIQQ